MTLSADDLARYSRHLALRELGVAGQEKLKAAKVLVIGAGGLGSPSILYLAAAGVGTLGIVDFDSVDISNLQRQVLFDTDDVGVFKAEAASARLRALNPHMKVVAHRVELQASNVLALFKQYDIVLDGTDRFSTRYLTNDACVILGKPLVSAAIHRFEGQAFTYVPKRGPCYRCLFPEPPGEGLVPNCAEAGVLGVLPGVLGTLQATEAIKLITGIGEPLLGRLLTYDALEMRFGEFKFSRSKDCAVCGDTPTIHAPQDPPSFCSIEQFETLDRLDPKELATLLGEPQYALIDVREPHEYSLAHFDRAVNIPVGEMAARVHELSPQQTPIFICRSGVRSQTAAGVLLRAGKKAAHLEGGLLAWTREIDPSFKLN
ncbi:MAG TPA: molybdopterin-synthase adenylyltransferase MoeB [Steroidobacteraceae bacterium]|nr:molybdopterin-synthase adenylyltransferase MoeB [Steroidobacteraceae bacterium]